MRKSAFIVTVIIMAAVAGTTAARADHRDNPSCYFLNLEQVPDSKKLLPPPPADSSARWWYDVECYYNGKKLRDTPRGDLAASDAELDDRGLTAAFSEAFGMDITPEATPEVYRLITGMREDAGDLATRGAKVYYQRERPYIHFGEHTCVPDAEAHLAGNGSYPSGHTAKAWATALILAEVNPWRQDEILSRGFEMGQSRVICGYHYQSDVDAGRIVGSAVVARLHADDAFLAQLAKAREEMKRLVAAGAIEQ